MDPRVFVLICLAAASRHQPSSVLEVEAGLPTGPKHEFNETDFQLLRDGVNSIGPVKSIQLSQMEIWPSFLKAHPKEGLDLFKKLVREDAAGIFRKAAAESPAWPMLLETHNAEAWHLFQKLAQDENIGAKGVREAAATSPAWPMLLQTHNAEAWRLFQKLAQDKDAGVRKAATESPTWPMLLETHNAEAWRLFQKQAQDKDADVRKAAVVSPEWPMLLETHNAEAWQLFQKLAKDEDVDVREAATESPTWPMLLETHNAEAWQLFQKLAKDEDAAVRKAATESPAWPMLLETHNAEAVRLFEKLATDENGSVRKDAAMSSAWPDLVRSNWWESWRVFVKLMSDQGLGHLPAGSTSWKSFGTIPRAAVEEHLDSCTPTDLQEMAMSAQKVADNGFTPNVKDLPVVKGLGTRLQRSANETWLGKMAEMPLFAGNAAQRISPAQDVSTVLTSKFEYPAKEYSVGTAGGGNKFKGRTRCSSIFQFNLGF